MVPFCYPKHTSENGWMLWDQLQVGINWVWLTIILICLDKNSFLLYGGAIAIKAVVGTGGVGIVPAAISPMGFMGHSPGVKRISSIAMSPRQPTTVASISTCTNMKWFPSCPIVINQKPTYVNRQLFQRVIYLILGHTAVQINLALKPPVSMVAIFFPHKKSSPVYWQRSNVLPMHVVLKSHALLSTHHVADQQGLIPWYLRFRWLNIRIFSCEFGEESIEQRGLRKQRDILYNSKSEDILLNLELVIASVCQWIDQSISQSPFKQPSKHAWYLENQLSIKQKLNYPALSNNLHLCVPYMYISLFCFDSSKQKNDISQFGTKTLS